MPFLERVGTFLLPDVSISTVVGIVLLFVLVVLGSPVVFIATCFRLRRFESLARILWSSQSCSNLNPDCSAAFALLRGLLVSPPGALSIPFYVRSCLVASFCWWYVYWVCCLFAEFWTDLLAWAFFSCIDFAVCCYLYLSHFYFGTFSTWSTFISRVKCFRFARSSLVGLLLVAQWCFWSSGLVNFIGLC